jgi:hypothetical protein
VATRLDAEDEVTAFAECPRAGSGDRTSVAATLSGCLTKASLGWILTQLQSSGVMGATLGPWLGDAILDAVA